MTLLSASLAALLLASSTDSIQLVESFPAETDLDHVDIPETHDVWIEMIDGAQESIELSHFYASNQEGSRLEPVIEALIAAGARGVAVRFLASERFYSIYPATLDRLNASPGIDVRRFDVRALTGGVMHAKAMIVDGHDSWIGSANFDWRSLEHIQELGIRVRSQAVARAWTDVFELDWHLANGGSRDDAPKPTAEAADYPVAIDFGGSEVKVTPVASPTELLPDEGLWDLPFLLDAIDSAEASVDVQVMTYRAVDYHREYFAKMEAALRGAAARGVTVRLLVADWGKREGTIESLKSLQHTPGLEVRMVTVPEHSSGFVPYGRVVHAKHMIADGRRTWVGTSNWEKGYFDRSRNLGLIAEGEALGGALTRFFETGWTSSMAYAVDPCEDYAPPRIGD